MSKKDAKVSEAQLPMPPAVEAFIGALEEWKGKKPAARGEHKYKNSSDKHGHAHEASANKQCNSRQDVLVAQGQADCTRHANT